jgi:predicted DNA-binding protein
MKVRTNIQLEPEQDEALRKLAYELRRSLSSLVREAVEKFLEEKSNE